MIFISVGSREYPFDRLLKKIDQLISEGVINEEVFGQIGESNYIPKHFSYERFLSQPDFQKKQEEADIVISHGGTGALVGALKKHKQVIAVPRLARFGEHIDDHQLQVSNALAEGGYLKIVKDMDQLGEALLMLKSNPIQKRYDKPSKVIPIIKSFIEEN